MISVRLVIILSMLLMTSQVNSAEQYSQARSDFLAAETSDWDINGNAYQSKLKSLANYPLQPYFQQQQLLKNISLKNEAQIVAFITEYSDTPVAAKVRIAWLNYLTKKHLKSRFIEYFKAPMNSRLTCTYYDYLLDSGAEQQAILTQVTRLWLVGKSQPDECNRLFKVWTENGYISNELLWQRIMLAQAKRQYLLVKYLGKQLPSEEQYLFTLWTNIKRNPKLVARLDKFKRLTKQETQVIIDGIKRLSRRDDLLALDVYKAADAQGRFSPLQKELVIKPLITALSRSDDPLARQWYESIDAELINQGILQWRLAKDLKKADHQGVLKNLSVLTEAMKNERQWLYWQARSLELTGAIKQAQQIYTSLAKQRSYYGFLAAARIGATAVMNHQALQVTNKEKQDIIKHPAGQRALELYKMKRFTLARREWHHWMANLTDPQQLVAAQLAHQQGWYDRGIYSLSQVGALNDIDIRFPMPFDDVFTQFSQQYNINPAWAYAIARKESIFMSDASSSAGALGLMQVIPATATYINGNKIHPGQLLQVDTNVKLGINYLSYLLKKFDNNIVLATAAYNAGPNKVKRWLKTQPMLTADAWIETIPYKETRNYVKSVLAYTEIYQQKQGLNKSPFTDLLVMNIE